MPIHHEFPPAPRDHWPLQLHQNFHHIDGRYQNKIAAITRFLTELDLFLSDLAQFSSDRGILPYSHMLFLQARLTNICEELSLLFSKLDPSHKIINENKEEEIASVILARLSK